MKAPKIVVCVVLALMFMVNTGKAQGTSPAPDLTSQMWNVANGYYGTVNSRTIGYQLDTVKGTTIYLYVSNWNTIGTSAYDSARIFINSKKQTGGLPGYGSLSFSARALKGAVNSATVTVTPEQSANALGSSWTTIPGVTTATLSATSTTVAATTSFNLQEKYQRYYRLKITTTDTASIVGYYYYINKY